MTQGTSNSPRTPCSLPLKERIVQRCEMRSIPALDECRWSTVSSCRTCRSASPAARLSNSRPSKLALATHLKQVHRVLNSALLIFTFNTNMEAVAAATTPALPGNDSSVCWICLEGESLAKPCKCACMTSHQQCLAAWQLAKAGTRDEVQCRFCLSALPAWQPVLRHSLDKLDAGSALPVVAVVYGGQEYRLTVQPTAEGLRRFGKQVEIITGQPFSDVLDVCFFCKSPTGYNLQLHGVQSLEAAMTCAAVTAAGRGQLELPNALDTEPKDTPWPVPTAADDTRVEACVRMCGAGSAGPAAMVAADSAAADVTGGGDWDATATILHAGPARRLPPVDIVEYWRRQQLQRLQAETTAAAAAAALATGSASASAAAAGEGRAGNSSQEAPVSAYDAPGRASCLPLHLSSMLKRMLPSW